MKNPSANAGDASSALSQEDPPENEMTTHSSVVAMTIPWTEKPGSLQSLGSQKSQTQLSH